MSALAGWLESRTAGAPAVLADRVRAYALGESAADAHAPPAMHPRVLAAAGATALATVTARPGDRSVALDLLAADALITLALLAQAEHDPAGLRALAAELLRRHGPAA